MFTKAGQLDYSVAGEMDSTLRRSMGKQHRITSSNHRVLKEVMLIVHTVTDD